MDTNTNTWTLNYVIAAWGGDRRGGSSDIVYARKQIEQLQKLQHSITQVTLCVSSDAESNTKLDSYLEELEAEGFAGLPIKIIRRHNIGLSYGAYSDVYEIYRDQFDYYIFMEDDYYFAEHDFDTTLVKMFEKGSKCGYVCGFVSKAKGKKWMGNSNGLTSSKVLEQVRNKYGKLPYDSSCVGNTYTEESGQVTFSDAFIGAGFRLRDITSKYEILHYYWQHAKVMPIPGQRAKWVGKHLLAPFEKSMSVLENRCVGQANTSALNTVFAEYRDRHAGKEAIVFATGPTLKAYDYLEDDGTRLKVGVNSMALRDIALDYYFCGHVDGRSMPYLDGLSGLKVGIEKFGYVTLNGVSSAGWLSLDKAKSLGLKPYGLTTQITFGQDISRSCLVNHLIIFSALQFLVYTGVSKIYLVGSDATQLVSCDNYYLDNNRNIERVKDVFKQFADSVCGEVDIVSINPIGLEGMFTDVFRCDVGPYTEGKEHPKPANYSNVQNESLRKALGGGYG
jgi:hypothetical protein